MLALPSTPRPTGYAQIQHFRNAGNAGGKLHIGNRAVANAGLRFGKEKKLLVVKMNAVRVPDVAARPAQRFHIRQRAEMDLFKRIILFVLRFAQMRVQANAVLPREQRALTQKIGGDGKRRTGRERDPAHGLEGRIVICLDQADAVLENCVDGLHDRIGREPAVFAGKIHAAAGEMHAYPERFRRCALRADEIARVFGENIVMVEAGGAAVFHQFAHAGHGGEADGVLVEPFPDLIERDQPVEELHVLNLRQIAGKHLIQVMMRVDQTRIAKHAGCVDCFVRRRTGAAYGFDSSVATKEIDVGKYCILRVAGYERGGVSDQKRAHGWFSLFFRCTEPGIRHSLPCAAFT